MTHHVYQTTAIIIESTNSGEANKFYTLFTEDIGLLQATAQGVRFLKSKLRFSLQPLSYVRVSLVRGRSAWRIVNAEHVTSWYTETKDQPEKQQALVRILRILKRLVQGEEQNRKLFTEVFSGCSFLLQTQTREQIRNTEYIVVLKILFQLGYLAKIEEFTEFLHQDINAELVKAMSAHVTKARAEINTSLKETQL